MTRLDPSRFPWTMVHLAVFCAAAFGTYIAVHAATHGEAAHSPASALIQPLILAVAFVIPALVVARLKRVGIARLWAPRDELGRDIAAGLVLGMLLACMNGIAIVMAVRARGGDVGTALERITYSSGGLANVSCVLLGIGFVAPLAEEVFFRGVMYPALRKRLPALPSIILSAGIFGVSHLNHMWVQTFLLGVVAAVLVEYTGSLVPAVLAHVGVNASFVLFLANGSVLARRAPLEGLVAAFAVLNVLLFLLGKPLFDARPAAAPDQPTEAPDDRP